MRPTKSRIHGTPRARRTGSAPVSQTGDARTTSATKIAARVCRIIVAGSLSTALTEGGLRKMRPVSVRLDIANDRRPGVMVSGSSVDVAHDCGGDGGRRA